jgi:hypothetical protein
VRSASRRRDAQLKAWLDEARRAPNEKRPLPADAKTANFIIAAEIAA